MKIGVLAVQGDFAEHILMLKKLGADCIELRKKGDLLEKLDGLVLPGGESTVIGKLLTDLDMMDSLRNLILGGLPVFGTCAGMILLAGKIENNSVTHLGTMDISVVRNAYGRQLGSFRTVSKYNGEERILMPFIRAPFIRFVGSDVQILAVVDGKIVAAQQGNQLVTAFHPELAGETVVHGHFLEIAKNHQQI